MATLPQDAFAEARELYRDELVRSFRYTAMFFGVTGCTADDVVNSPAFAAVLSECKPGSLDCARRIGEMAVVHLDSPRSAPGPWWRDLCNYERGYFLQAATTDVAQPTNRPRRGASALCT